MKELNNEECKHLADLLSEKTSINDAIYDIYNIVKVIYKAVNEITEKEDNENIYMIQIILTMLYNYINGLLELDYFDNVGKKI